MPRPNRPRSLGSERELARRIALLCEQHNMKYPELAERMTTAGCPIQPSALYKLSQDPPRRITVNELVAIANIFNLAVNDLLRPIAVVEKEWAEEVARDWIGATFALDDAQAEAVRAAIKLAHVARQSPDLAEYVEHQWKTASPGRQWFAEFVGTVNDEQLGELAELSNNFWKQVLEVIDDLSSEPESVGG